MRHPNVDAILKHQREVIAKSRGTVERSFDVMARTDELIRSTRCLLAHRTAHRGAAG